MRRFPPWTGLPSGLPFFSKILRFTLWAVHRHVLEGGGGSPTRFYSAPRASVRPQRPTVHFVTTRPGPPTAFHLLVTALVTIFPLGLLPPEMRPCLCTMSSQYANIEMSELASAALLGQQVTVTPHSMLPRELSHHPFPMQQQGARSDACARRKGAHLWEVLRSCFLGIAFNNQKRCRPHVCLPVRRAPIATLGSSSGQRIGGVIRDITVTNALDN